MEPIIYNLGNGFQQILNPDGTIQIVPIEETNNLPFTSMATMDAANQFPILPGSSTFPLDAFKNTVAPKGVNTGITASSAAIPFKQDPIAIAQGFVEGSPSDASFPGTNFQFLPSASEADETDEVKQKSGIAKLFDFLQKFSPINIVRGLLPEQDPRTINMRNFYGSQYGLTPTGSLASGIMAGYNPISGGLFGSRVNYGLANAARKRIEKIANRKAPQTDASRAKIKELQEFADRDTISRARQAAPDVYKSAERQGFTGPRGGFSTSGREGAFSSKTGRGRQDY